MKQLKFGVFDFILMVAIVVVIVANVAVYKAIDSQSDDFDDVTNSGDSGGNYPTDMSSKTWYLYYELHTDKDAQEPIYWYYYSAEFIHLADDVYAVELTSLDGNDFPDNPYYPGGGHMPAFSIEASAILHTNGELTFLFNGDIDSMMVFNDWQWDSQGGGWIGMAWQVGDEVMGQYSKLAMITDMP